MKKRPHILIPLPAHNTTTPPKYGIKQSHADAVIRAGGEPICIVRPDNKCLSLLLPFVGGIFLVGGYDINSEHYGEENTGHTKHIDHERDRVELALIRLAIKHRIPLLGVCRGMQAMNVALGGSLYQDVLTDMQNALDHDRHVDKETGEDLPHSALAHDVVIQTQTLLARLTGKKRIAVNSLHHQGVKKLGKGLLASAHSPDGLIEAIELKDYSFGMGVEWHPEELGDKTSQRIFQAFINAAREK